MASKIKVDQLETADGSGTIALQNQLSGMTTASLPALGFAQMPSGSVLQVATDYDGDSITMSTSSWQTTNLSIAFTPKKSDSKIVITSVLNLFMAGSGSQHGSAQGQIKKDGSDLGELVWVWCGYGGTEAQATIPSTLIVEETSGSTSARTYSVSVRNYQTGGGSTFNPYTGKSSLVVMEIAG